MTQAQNDTAILLIGFQNDYFAEDGALRPVIEEGLAVRSVLDETAALLEGALELGMPIVHLPSSFGADYAELEGAVGLMAHVKEVGALRADESGSALVPEVAAFGDQLTTLSGKVWFNGFVGTGLDEFLRASGIRRLALAGVITSVCIDSTGRAAVEHGYSVHVLSDCVAGRDAIEDAYYAESVFPLYCSVKRSDAFLAAARAATVA